MVRFGASVTPSIGASPITGCCNVSQKDGYFIILTISAASRAKLIFDSSHIITYRLTLAPPRYAVPQVANRYAHSLLRAQSRVPGGRGRDRRAPAFSLRRALSCSIPRSSRTGQRAG